MAGREAALARVAQLKAEHPDARHVCWALLAGGQSAANDGVYIAANRASTFQQTTTRAWVDGNGNFNPDCNLNSGAAQDNRATASEILGLSRQSLYVKLRQYGIGNLGGEDK